MVNRRELLKRARANRQVSTRSEALLWKLLRCNQLAGLKFRRQHVVENFIVDFACAAKRAIVEIDGGYHEFNEQRDIARQRRLEALGWRVIRFTDHDIEDNSEAVLQAIVNALSIDFEFRRHNLKQSGMMVKRVQPEK